jgi:hypothetical protein
MPCQHLRSEKFTIALSDPLKELAALLNTRQKCLQRVH